MGFHLRKHPQSPVAVLDRGGRDRNGPDQSQCVHDQMAFTAFDLFARVIADSLLRFSRPPFSVVLTDWLSRIAAEGSASLPAWWRTLLRRHSCRRSNRPSCVHW